MDPARVRRIIGWAALLLVALSISVPFLGKPFNIDDPLFLSCAEHIRDAPGDPLSAEVNWSGRTQRLFDFFSNPPGMCYYLALVLKLLGASEAAVHVGCLPFSVIAAFSIYWLAARFTQNPLAVSLSLLLCPLYWVMATTVMPDVALLAFFTGSLALYVHGFDRSSWPLLILSGIAASCALMLRYSGLAVPAVMALYYCIYWRKGKALYFLPLLIPAAVFTWWCVWTSGRYGESHFIAQLGFQEYLGIPDLHQGVGRLSAHLCYIGGATVFPVFFFLPSFRDKFTARFVLPLTALLSAVLWLVFVQPKAKYTAVNAALGGLFLWAAVFFFAAALVPVLGKMRAKAPPRDDVFLLLWALGIIVMQNSGVHAAAKYMLPAAVPVAFVLFRSMSVLSWPENLRRAAIALLVTSTAAAGLLVSLVDYESAGALREAAYYCRASANDQAAGRYFCGHWGFQFYLEREGFKPYEEGSIDLKKGDYLAVVSLAWPQSVPEALMSRLKVVGRRAFTPLLPLRTMHNRQGEQADFYSCFNHPLLYGVLPYSYAKAPLCAVVLYVVVE